MKTLIFLTGMPAAGKTYWGERTAQYYGMRFIDLDTYIAGQEQKSIAELFAEDGEKRFREKEHQYLRQVIDNLQTNTIVACGGGTPNYHQNMHLMKTAGCVIYLQADVAWLLENIRRSHEIRPLLVNRMDTTEYLQQLLEERRPVYEQAHFILPAEGISFSTFEEIIATCTNKH